MLKFESIEDVIKLLYEDVKPSESDTLKILDKECKTKEMTVQGISTNCGEYHRTLASLLIGDDDRMCVEKTSNLTEWVPKIFSKEAPIALDAGNMFYDDVSHEESSAVEVNGKRHHIHLGAEDEDDYNDIVIICKKNDDSTVDVQAALVDDDNMDCITGGDTRLYEIMSKIEKELEELSNERGIKCEYVEQ